MSRAGFLGTPEQTAEAQRLFDDDVAEDGYVSNVSRLWAYQPGTLSGLFDLMRQALAAWARQLARDPNHTSPEDVQGLRDAGYSDPQIFAFTAFVALRIAFSTVNGALGARPGAEFRGIAPQAVLDAVTFGRPIDDATARPGNQSG